MPTIKRKHKQLLNPVSVNLGCSCMKPKLFSIFSPKPANRTKLPNYSSKHQKLSQYFSTTSMSTQTTSSFSSRVFKDYPSSSSSDHLVPYFVCDRSAHPVVGAKTVAVEKDSEDPYLDFRHSMLQMIVENDMYTKDELMELLNCFLQLNSACLHGVIIRVFIDICSSFFFTSGGAYVNPCYFAQYTCFLHQKGERARHCASPVLMPVAFNSRTLRRYSASQKRNLTTIETPPQIIPLVASR